MGCATWAMRSTAKPEPAILRELVRAAQAILEFPMTGLRTVANCAFVLDLSGLRTIVAMDWVTEKLRRWKRGVWACISELASGSEYAV
jgi:hypothetical protein